MISLSILKGTQTVILYITVNFSRSVKGKPARTEISLLVVHIYK